MFQRRTANEGGDDKEGVNASKLSSADVNASKEEAAQPPSSLVFGYLNLFSDGVVCVSTFVLFLFHKSPVLKFQLYFVFD